MNDILSDLKIAAPCPAEWQKMTGNDQVRLCESCKLNVYNISEMTKAEAEQLITNTEGRVCLRLYKRKDGTVITENCPVGLRLIKRKFKWLAAAVLSAMGITIWITDCIQGKNMGTEPKRIEPYVAVAKRTIRAGESLTNDVLMFEQIPYSQFQGLKDPCDDLTKVVGRKVTKDIAKGTIIANPDLMPMPTR